MATLRANKGARLTLERHDTLSDGTRVRSVRVLCYSGKVLRNTYFKPVDGRPPFSNGYTVAHKASAQMDAERFERVYADLGYTRA